MSDDDRPDERLDLAPLHSARPPDQWDAIVARAGRLDSEESTASGGGRVDRRSGVLAAAGLLAAVAGVVVVGLASIDDDADTVRSTVADTEIAPSVPTSGAVVSTGETLTDPTSSSTVDSAADDSLLLTESGSPTTSLAPSSTVPSPGTVEPIRPLTDPDVCVPVAASREGLAAGGRGVTFFARPSENPIAVQIIGEPGTTPADAFALVQRHQDQSRPAQGGPETLTVGDVAISYGLYRDGETGQAAWNLADGTQGYLRSIDLTEAELIDLLQRLVPRPADADLPGFDVVPAIASDDAADFDVLHEASNTEIDVGRGNASRCLLPGTDLAIRVLSIRADPVAEFGVVLDRPFNPVVGYVDGALVLIDLPPSAEGRLAITDVRDADDEAWAALVALDEYPGTNTTPTAGPRFVAEDRDVDLPLPSGDGEVGGVLFARLVRAEGATSLEIRTRDARFDPAADAYSVEIGGRRSSYSQRIDGALEPGFTAGLRLGDENFDEPFDVEVIVLAGDVPLQTTGVIRLVPEP